jgi:hypothetical protein
MKRFTPYAVRAVAFVAATAITAVIFIAHDIDPSDLGGRDLVVSAPVVTVAATATRAAANAPVRSVR